ncbi:MAG: DUF3846 domain-containing protein [Clostridia bacterium]|nr:DUF3846 domain-containing protein [Clostridia bacterium]
MVIERLRINVLVVNENKEPCVNRIWNNLEELRNLVGVQNIDVIEYEKALLVYDEDALKKLLPINRYVDDKAIRGTFVITGNDKKTKDFTDLSKQQIQKYKEQFSLQREEEIEFE